MNHYITILSSNDDYDKMADEMLKLFGTLHVFLRNDIKTIEIKNHEIDQNIYDKMSKILSLFLSENLNFPFFKSKKFLF